MLNFTDRRQQRLLALIPIILLAHCGPVPNSTAPGDAKQKASISQHLADDNEAELVASFTNELGNENRYLVMPADSSPESMFERGRDACKGESSCFAYVWFDAKDAGSGWPLLPREEQTHVFRYQLKRYAKFEKGFWDCKRFKKPEQDCIYR